jgi:hypothetical protein
MKTSIKTMLAQNMSLTEIEQRLHDEGYKQDEIDNMLAFIVYARDGIATLYGRHWSPGMERPS